jgi:hypothetical protein
MGIIQLLAIIAGIVAGVMSQLPLTDPVYVTRALGIAVISLGVGLLLNFFGEGKL